MTLNTRSERRSSSRVGNIYNRKVNEKAKDDIVEFLGLAMQTA